MKETRVTIHQPEHFPYMGFFQKISASDVFIVLDDVKFKKNNFQNRNRIKTLAGNDDWITVHVEKRANSKDIKDVSVSSEPRWRKKLLKKIYQNFKFDASEFYSHEKLIDINMAGIRWAFDKINMKVPVVFSSELQVSGSKSVFLANLVRSVGGTKYISGQGGKNYLDLSPFGDIEVEFFSPQVDNYYSCLWNLLK